MNPKILLRRLYNHSKIQLILFATYHVDELVVLGDMIGTLSTTKFVGKRKEYVNRSRLPIMTSKTRPTTQESGEFYFDDETGEDSKIGITKVFH